MKGFIATVRVQEFIKLAAPSAPTEPAFTIPQISTTTTTTNKRCSLANGFIELARKFNLISFSDGVLLTSMCYATATAEATAEATTTTQMKHKFNARQLHKVHSSAASNRKAE